MAVFHRVRDTQAERWQQVPAHFTRSGLGHLGEILSWPLGAFCFPGRERGTLIEEGHSSNATKEDLWERGQGPGDQLRGYGDNPREDVTSADTGAGKEGERLRESPQTAPGLGAGLVPKRSPIPPLPQGLTCPQVHRGTVVPLVLA